MTLLTAFLLFAWAEPQNLAGEYLVRAASCRECHTIPGQTDFAGGLPIVTVFGRFYPPNITPDAAFGIGAWTFLDFKNALRSGISPQHKIYYPVFPYRSFTKITDDDLLNMFNYLRAQPPSSQPNHRHELKAPYGQRRLLWFWQAFFFQNPGRNSLENIKTAAGPFQGDSEKSQTWNRGAYLVEAVLHCTECHTPRNFLGALKADEWMAGSDLVFSKWSPPNITPDPETGLRWTKEEWLEFLRSGIDSRGKTAAAEMALVVRATAGLTRADREAVVEYLMSLAPVRRLTEEVPP